MTPLDAKAPATQPRASAPPPGLGDVVDLSSALTPTLGRRPAPGGLRALRPAGLVLDGGPAGATAIGACGSSVVVATGPQGCLRVVDVAAPHAAHRVLGAHGAPVQALVTCGGVVVSAGADGRVLAWRIGPPGSPPGLVGRHPVGVTAMAMSPDGAVVTAGHDGQVLAWREQAPYLLCAHAGGVECVSVLASGAVVTAGRDGRLLCRARCPGGPAVELRQRRPEITLTAACVGPDAFVTASGQLGAVRLWRDLGDDAWPQELGIHGGWVLALVAPDADHVAAVGGDHVTLWDLRTRGAATRIELGSGVHAAAAAVLATGAVAVATADGGVRLLETLTLAA